MANVFLTSAADSSSVKGRLELRYIRESAERDKYGVHSVTENPDAADLILFVERDRVTGERQEAIRTHHLVQERPQSCFVVNPRYRGIPYLPGVYASIRKKWYDRSRVRSGHYLEVRENQYFRDLGPPPEEGYLYCFRGKIGTAPVRRRLLNLRHPRGYIEDTSDKAVSVMKVEPMTAQRATYTKKYADLTVNSKFVLCPRGVTPSSLRLFETMLMGRVPVIISDQWVEPEGPNWNEFSIQVPESEIHRIPDLLAGRESKAQEMARAAREAWENWFSVEVSFHRVVESCRRISTAQPTLRDVVRRYRGRANSSHAVRVTERTINIVKRKYHGLKDSLHNNAD